MVDTGVGLRHLFGSRNPVHLIFCASHKEDMLLSFSSGSAYKGVFFQWDGELGAQSSTACSSNELRSFSSLQGTKVKYCSENCWTTVVL